MNKVSIIPEKTIIDQINDKVTVFGLVNGNEYSVTVWKSHLDQQTGTAAQRKHKIRQYIAEQLALLAKRDQPIPPTNFDIGGAEIDIP